MKTSKRKSTTGSVLANLAGRTLLVAAAFALVGTGTPQAEGVVTDRDWINIGDTSNQADGSTYGAVNYEYRISGIETTVEDWDAFYGNGTDIGDGTAVGNFNSGYDDWTKGTYDAHLDDDSPVVNVSMHQAAQYANWLTTGDATDGAYDIDGSSGEWTGDYNYGWTSHEDIADDDLAGETVYVLPTENEWYKAAYYDLDAADGTYWDYANGTDDTPTQATASDDTEYKALDETSGWNYDNGITAYRDGGSHPWENATGTQEENGTYDMMGNVYEWQEDTGGVGRGGQYGVAASRLSTSYRQTGYPSTDEKATFGFRVVAIPEPASGVLFVLVGGLLWFVRRRGRA